MLEKIVEEVDLSVDEDYSIRCKGKLVVHGVTQERIIKCKVKKNGETIEFEGQLEVLLEDHNINIPKIVFQKIAETINITINGTLSKRNVP